MKSWLGSCLTVAITLVCWLANAQTQRCHTTEYLEELKKSDTQLAQRIENAKNAAFQYLQNRPAQKSGARAIITIPVVVHVMHNGEAIGTGANISDAQIFSQIEVLNEDYQNLNSDLSDVPAHFTSIVGDPELEFCLAQLDPEGNPTTGIDRVDMGSGSWSDGRKPGTIWDPSQYLNLWVAQISGGVLGYATYPGTSPSSDGVVIDYRYFGKAPENPFNSDFDLGRTGTHEIGHWLGLDHTFQGGCTGLSSSNCGSQGDRICDTPPTSSANYGCSLSSSRNTCTETPIDQPDMWMNFMDYMDDACLLMFSQEQTDVMRAVLNTSRVGILSSIACDAQNLFSYSGKVVDAQSGQGVANAKVLFQGTGLYEIETDANGDFTSPNFREGTYDIYAGKWGYMTKQFSTNTFIDAGSSTYTIPIQKGFYYDDFILNYEWATSGSASSGLWERDIPVETDYNGSASNPGEDITGDFGNKSFVTGNGGGSAGNDDVDEGDATLTSPLFDLTNYNEPYISYYRWFFNDGGQGNPDDQLVISISNGAQTQVIETIDANTANSNQWNFKNIRVADYITPTATMRFIVETSDQTSSSSGHLVEGAFDGFQVVDSMPTAIADLSGDFRFLIYPNPAADNLSMEVESSSPETAQIMIFDASGRSIYSTMLNALANRRTTISLAGFADGVYFVKLVTRDISEVRKVTIIR